MSYIFSTFTPPKTLHVCAQEPRRRQHGTLGALGCRTRGSTYQTHDARPLLYPWSSPWPAEPAAAHLPLQPPRPACPSRCAAETPHSCVHCPCKAGSREGTGRALPPSIMAATQASMTAHPPMQGRCAMLATGGQEGASTALQLFDLLHALLCLPVSPTAAEEVIWHCCCSGGKIRIRARARTHAARKRGSTRRTRSLWQLQQTYRAAAPEAAAAAYLIASKEGRSMRAAAAAACAASSLRSRAASAGVCGRPWPGGWLPGLPLPAAAGDAGWWPNPTACDARQAGWAGGL